MHQAINRTQTQALLEQVERERHPAGTPNDDETWIWSDLHLGHGPSLRAFRRPFRYVTNADSAMLTAWREAVGEHETILCLGDVTVDGQAYSSHHYRWNHNGALGSDEHDVRGCGMTRIRETWETRTDTGWARSATRR